MYCKIINSFKQVFVIDVSTFYLVDHLCVPCKLVVNFVSDNNVK